MAISENENYRFSSRAHINESLSRLKGKIVKESAAATALFTLALPAMYASMVYPGPGATLSDIPVVLAWEVVALGVTFSSMFGGAKLVERVVRHNQERNELIRKAQEHGFPMTGILFKRVK